MRVNGTIISSFIVLNNFIVCCFSARILGFFPFKSVSHNAVFLPLIEQLANNGHEVLIVSYSTKNSSMSNYKHIPLDEVLCKHKTFPFLMIEYFENNSGFGINNLFMMWRAGEYYEQILNSTIVSNLLKEKPYDLIITEMFNSNLFYGLFYRLNAPVVAITSSELYPWHNYMIGNPLATSYMLHSAAHMPYPMNVYGRLINVLESFTTTYIYYYLNALHCQDIAERYLHGKLPNLANLVSNTSLVLVNSHFTILGAKPRTPNIIDVGGIHLAPVQPLPQHLQTIMDEAKNGVIYFSLGSTINMNGFDKNKMEIFAKVLSDLKQTILWKTDVTTIKQYPNIVTSTWFPQRDILAHPHVRLFISQCGILSVIEAVDSAVPTLCIPILGDQNFNGRSLENNECGLVLDFNNITEISLKDMINTIINNKSYKKKVTEMSNAFKDRPMSAMDTAVYWIEYVIRHNGAELIKSAAKQLSWYEYHNMDVAVIVILSLVIVFIIIKRLIIFSLYIIKNKSRKVKSS